jgi:hypothetical protein
VTALAITRDGWAVTQNYLQALIRTEYPSDILAIHFLNRNAFNGATEAKLVDQLRRSETDSLSLAAEGQGHIDGHIHFTPLIVTVTKSPACAACPVSPATGTRSIPPFRPFPVAWRPESCIMLIILGFL